MAGRQLSNPFDPTLVRQLIDDGESLAAYDAAMSMEVDDGDAIGRVQLAYLRALSLARAGATQRAAVVVNDIAVDDGLPAWLCEDVLALSARLAKDRALASTGAARASALRDAAERYEDVARRYDRPFAMVNAASMWLLAGDTERGRLLAERALEVTPGSSSSYWDEATRAEAFLVLGRVGDASDALHRAGSMASNGGTRATTRRQLQLLCDHLQIGTEVLAPLDNPAVVHFGGQMWSAVAAMAATDAAALDVRIRDWLAQHRVGDAYGALAFGADIVFAEALLDHGARLHVVLPLEIDQFVEVSVRPAGEDWVRRFHGCLDRATSVEVTFEGIYGDDDGVFAYASDIAMGHAVTRARWLQAPALQLVAWDGQQRERPAGTARDVGVWERRGGTTVVFDLPPGSGAPAADRMPTRRRRVGVALFGDFAGFSAIRDDQYALFVEHVLGAIAAVVDRYGDSVVQRNTWGDGILLMMHDVDTAADLALSVQERLATLDLTMWELPASLRLRLSAHAGPVVEVTDPLLGTDILVGRSLTRAARMEPRTPPGEVYVSAAFAALLALVPEASANTEYVGRLTTAKDFETLPMYVLRRP